MTEQDLSSDTTLPSAPADGEGEAPEEREETRPEGLEDTLTEQVVELSMAEDAAEEAVAENIVGLAEAEAEKEEELVGDAMELAAAEADAEEALVELAARGAPEQQVAAAATELVAAEAEAEAELEERAKALVEAEEVAEATLAVEVAAVAAAEDVAEQAAVEEVEEAEEVAEEGELSTSKGPGEWYVVHTYAGYENKVKTNLKSRIASMQMEEKIFDCVIPMEDVMEIKGGKKQVVQKKVFPGYLLVRMIYDNDSWYVVRNTPGVTGFVSSGTGSKPTPLSPREVEKILAVKKETQKKPEYRLEFDVDDVVRIVTGPFADFTGTIAEINVEQSKLKVMVNIFDRETPVELAFDQVAKA